MIVTTYDELGKMQVQQAVQKLANSTFKTPQAFMVKHLTKAVRDGFFKMRDEYKTEIEEKFLEKDEKADKTKSEELKLPFTCKAGLEGDCKGLLDAFGKKEFKIDKKKISASLLFEVNEWSPRELEALEFLVDENA